MDRILLKDNGGVDSGTTCAGWATKGTAGEGNKDRKGATNICDFVAFLAKEEPKNINDVFNDENWIMEIQEELNQSERCDVWELKEPPKDASTIFTKWVFKYKVDEFGNVTRNKANLVTIPKPRSEWTDEDIEAVHMDKKAMNIMFNGLDGDMFDNDINFKTTKDIWNNIQVICDGTEQEWKPMTVSFRNSQEYKDFTLERLFGILKTYELEMEQDEKLEKGRKKGGSIALVAE
ncbi:hypothetical protein AgCh_032320 [Apium graveolens]